jgi:hypothetical protein
MVIELRPGREDDAVARRAAAGVIHVVEIDREPLVEAWTSSKTSRRDIRHAPVTAE